MADSHLDAAFKDLALEQKPQDRLENLIAKHRKALLANPNSAEMHRRLAKSLTTKGMLTQAAQAYLKSAEINPACTKSHIYLSAIQHRNGHTDQARATLLKGVRTHPFMVKKCNKAPEATILRVRGLENGFYTLSKNRNGHFRIKLCGGNFSDTHLTDMDRFSTLNFLVSEGNLLTFDDIPPFHILMNSIADPDVESSSLETLSKFLLQNPHIPLINHPDQVLKTTRDGNFQRLGALDGLLFPKTIRLKADHDMVKAVEKNGFTYPILVREPGTQTGRTFAILKSPQELKEKTLSLLGKELYVIQYVENPFLRHFFRKMRFFFVDGKPYPVVCHIDTKWNVHGSNRLKIMKKNNWMQEEEKSFMADCRGYLGTEQYNRLETLHDITGLDFFGVDFDLTPEGNILIFELNPAMRHNFEHARGFPYLRPYLQEITNAFNDMIIRKIGESHA